MAKEYTVSLREAVAILGKKPATVRAYVRSNRISKQYVEGFNGQEMRLNKEELEELKATLKETPKQPDTRTPRNTVKDRVTDTPLDTVNITASSDPVLNRAIELLETQLHELRKEKEELASERKELNEKNFNMAGQLGYFQNQVETLKDQVKQLTAPEQEAKASAHSKKTKTSFWGFLNRK